MAHPCLEAYISILHLTFNSGKHNEAKGDDYPMAHSLEISWTLGGAFPFCKGFLLEDSCNHCFKFPWGTTMTSKYCSLHYLKLSYSSLWIFDHLGVHPNHMQFFHQAQSSWWSQMSMGGYTQWGRFAGTISRVFSQDIFSKEYCGSLGEPRKF